VDVDAAAADLGGRNGFAIRSLRRHAAPGFSAVIPAPRPAAAATLHLPRETAKPGGGAGPDRQPVGSRGGERRGLDSDFVRV
jgi:hypothetical protein